MILLACRDGAGCPPVGPGSIPSTVRTADPTVIGVIGSSVLQLLAEVVVAFGGEGVVDLRGHAGPFGEALDAQLVEGLPLVDVRVVERGALCGGASVVHVEQQPVVVVAEGVVASAPSFGQFVAEVFEKRQ